MRSKDYAEKETDKMLDELEKKIVKIYSRAKKEVEEKFLKYGEDFQRKDEEMLKKYQSGKITEEQYKTWRQCQLFSGKRLDNLSKELGEDLVNADKLAMSVANGYTPEAYALNFNYETYNIEQNTQINTSFTLYSRETVERLEKGGRKVLPKRKVDVPKDKQWNVQHLRNEITQGVLQGKSIPEIAKSLRKVADMDRRASVRNARTMMTGAQNGGRLDAMKRASDMGIKIQKEWMATLDNRTRDSHAKMDGERIGITRYFSNGLQFPGDPNGRPEEVYNCRCTMVSFYPEYEGIIQKRTTYKDWAESRTSGSENKPVNEISWIEKIKEIQGRSVIDSDAVMEAGEVVSEQVHEYLDEMINEQNELKAEMDELGEKIDKLNSDIIGMRKDPKFKESERLFNFVMPIEDSSFFSTMESAEQWYVEHDKKIFDLNKVLDAYIKDYEIVQDKEANLFSQEKVSSLLKDLLSNIRPMGSEGLNIKSHLNNSRSEMRGCVEWAYDKYPTSWVKQSIAHGNLNVKKVNRGYYSEWEKIIAISGSGGDRSKETAIHELGHRFERAVEGIREQEKIFYDRRTDGEDLAWLGSGYAKYEKTRRDNFIHKYMGKDYGGSSYELVSMGFQYAYCEPEFLAKDEDMEKWIYGLLAVMP